MLRFDCNYQDINDIPFLAQFKLGFLIHEAHEADQLLFKLNYSLAIFRRLKYYSSSPYGI
jgi:hypothetical protein